MDQSLPVIHGQLLTKELVWAYHDELSCDVERFLLPRLVKRVLVARLARLILRSWLPEPVWLVLWLTKLRLLVRLAELLRLARLVRLTELPRGVVSITRNVQLRAELYDRQHAERDDRQGDDDCQEDRELRTAVQGDVRSEPVTTVGRLGCLQLVLCLFVGAIEINDGPDGPDRCTAPPAMPR